jgi:transcriptional regulator
VLLRERDQHIVQLQASGWQLARIASLYKVTKARIAQITKSIRLAGEDAMAVSCQGGDAR